MLLSAVLWCEPVFAQQTPFRVYSEDNGLTNVNPSCLKQDRSGYIFVCTEHGLFSYDGRRFFNLGAEEGLPDGGDVRDLVFTNDHRLILRYSSRLYVSREPLRPEQGPRLLSFQPILYKPGGALNEGVVRIVAWNNGAIMLDNQGLSFIDPDGPIPPDAAARKKTSPIIRSVDKMLDLPEHADRIVSVASIRSTLWVGTYDGRICMISASGHTCYGAPDGLPQESWFAILPLANGHVAARSLRKIVDLDPVTRSASVHSLPEQGGRYLLRPQQLLLVQSPSGALVTQAAVGLLVGQHDSWTRLITAGGMLSGPIGAVLFDHDGNFWIASTGRGVERALGYGIWENRDSAAELSSDLVWQMSRQPNGPLWVATDGGADAIGPDHGASLAKRVYDGATFSILADKNGHLWRSDGARGISCTTIATGKSQSFAMPAVNEILQGLGGRIWLMTESGVYVIDNAQTSPSVPRRLDGLIGSVTDGVVVPDGSLWLLHHRRLIHFRADGSKEVIEPPWLEPDYDPIVVTVGPPGTFWVGGVGGGLYRLRIDGGHVQALREFEPPDVLSNSIVALHVDRRGWVWVGSDRGISVYNGRRWVSADVNTGLVANDIDQSSLFEDEDGSMWIGTSQGLSHLLAPEKLFDQRPLQPVITAVFLGDALYRQRAVGFSREPLTIQFGALDFNADAVMRFRYRLDGVDSAWAETGTGFVRYPSLPYGHHTFSLVAIDPMTHQVSAPVSVMIRMHAPWWLWWPLVALYGVLVVAALYSAVRARDAYIEHRRLVLQRAVDLRTRELRESQARDSLTGLLTRGEIQFRLMTLLAEPERMQQTVVGLLDVDHFKSINDRFGHLAGDDILKEIGRRLKAELLPEEYAGRYGGEEILIMLKGGSRQAFDRIQDLCRVMCDRRFGVDRNLIRVTCSIGATRSRDSDDWKTLIGRADKALYRAKADGRDRMVIADEDALT